MKKVTAIILAIIMTASFAACNKQSDSLDNQTGSSEASSENHTDNTDDIEKPSADMIHGAVSGSELSSGNENNTTEKQNIGSNNHNEAAGDKNNSAINNSDHSANKPNNGNSSSNNKPNLPNSSNNNTGNNKPTAKPSNPVKPTEPDKTTTPTQHKHNWSSGWYDTEIAKDKSGNPVSLHLCAKCYEYFGSTNGDEWVGRFWDHCDTVHESGYTTWPLYAYYDAEWCADCGTMKRGKFAFYGYCDYSVSNKVSTRKLEPWQVKELNLPLK